MLPLEVFGSCSPKVLCYHSKCWVRVAQKDLSVCVYVFGVFMTFLNDRHKKPYIFTFCCSFCNIEYILCCYKHYQLVVIPIHLTRYKLSSIHKLIQLFKIITIQEKRGILYCVLCKRRKNIKIIV